MADSKQAGGSDESLLARMRAGDMAAFEVIVRRHRRAALAVARSMVDPVTAEDVVADSFERLLMAVRRGRGPRDVVRPYLLRVVRNRAVDVFRQREAPAEFDERNDATTEPQAQVEDRLLVRAAFESLPERWQVVLWMSAVEECDRHEIARQLGIGPGAVSQLLVRAKEGLRQAYLAQYSSAAEPECSEVSELLPPYVRGRASKREAVKVESHLAECERCPSVIGQLGALNRGLGAALGAALLGKFALDAYQAPPAAAGGLPARPLRGVTVATKVGSLVSAGLAAGALVVSVHAGGATSAGPAPRGADPAGGTVTAAVSPSGLPGSPRPSLKPSTRASDRAPASPRAHAPSSSASVRPTVSPRSVPTSPAPPVSPSPSATPTPSASVSATVSSTPSASSPPSVSSSPSASSPPAAAVVSVGRPVALPRADDALPVHVTVPVNAPPGIVLSATVTVPGMTAVRVHTRRAYGNWSCTASSSDVLSCELASTSRANDLGVDLDYTGAPVLRAEVAPKGSAPDPASGIVTLVLPRLPR